MSELWTTASPDPIYHRSWMGGGQVGSKLYMCGGDNNGTILRIYDMAGDSWSSGTPAVINPFQSASQCPVIGNKIYWCSNGYVQEYDTVGNSWQRWPISGTYGNYFPTMVALGTDIYIIGGWSQDTSFLKFNTVTHGFTQLPSLPGKVYIANVFPIDSNNFRLFGSVYGTGNASADWSLRYNWNYNASTGWDTSTYTQIPLEPDNPFIAGPSGPKYVGFAAAGAGRIGDNLLLVGGVYTTTFGTTHTRMYNLITDSWSDGLSKPTGFNVGVVGSYNNRFFFIIQNQNEVYYNNYIIDPPSTISATAGLYKNTITWSD